MAIKMLGAKRKMAKKFCYERPKWLTIELETKVRSLFEGKYKKSLQDSEVWEISMNLSNFVEVFSNRYKCYNKPRNR